MHIVGGAAVGLNPVCAASVPAHTAPYTTLLLQRVVGVGCCLPAESAVTLTLSHTVRFVFLKTKFALFTHAKQRCYDDNNTPLTPTNIWLLSSV